MSETTLRSRLFRYLPLIVWIAIIFVASSSTGSMSSTSRFVRPLLEWLFPDSPESVLAVYHGYIRKTAHVVEYAILAFWASRAFWGSSVELLHRFWPIAAFLAVAAVASLDEFNQSFNAMRTGSATDIAIDCAGGLAMIFGLIAYSKVVGSGQRAVSSKQ